MAPPTAEQVIVVTGASSGVGRAKVGLVPGTWMPSLAPREMLVGGPTLQGVWGQKFIPGVLDRLPAKAAWDPQFMDTPNDQQRDILFETRPGDPGPYRDGERGPDV